MKKQLKIVSVHPLPVITGLLSLTLVVGCGESSNKAANPSISTVNNKTSIKNPALALKKAGTQQGFSDYFTKAVIKQFNNQKNLQATDNMQSVPASTTASVATPMADGASSEAASGVSSTNLIEKGVDELDFAKQNQTHVFTTQSETTNKNHKINIFEKPTTNKISSIAINDIMSFKGMYLDANKLFSLQQKSYEHSYGHPTDLEKSQNTETKRSNAVMNLSRIDISNPNNPSITKTYRWEGNYQNSRKIGNSLYVVSNSNLNNSYVCAYTTAVVPDGAQQRTINRCPVTKELTPAEIANRMPLDINGNKIDPSDCYIPAKKDAKSINTNITLVTKVDLSGKEQHKTTCIAASVDNIYMSPKALYLTYSDYIQTGRYPSSRTILNKFVLNDSNLLYAGSGSVDGQINWNSKSFSLNEHNNILRVVTTTYDMKGKTINQLHTLRESSDTLDLINLATIPSPTRPKAIGKPHEQIKSVRFLGDDAYVVTFRRTDPLYRVDLSNPADPKIVGELQMPGYSAYLHKINEDFLLGVGFTTNEKARKTGIQTTVFDTRSNNPSIVSQDTIKVLDDASNYRKSFILPLEHDSRAITTLMNGSSLKLAIPYKIYDRKKDYEQAFHLKSLEYDINKSTGNIASKKDRLVINPVVVKKASVSKENANNKALINKTYDDYYKQLHQVQAKFSQHYERGLMDNNDIYYNLFDGNLVKHMWMQ